MPTMQGTILSTDGINFSLAFNIDDLPMYGSGRFLSSAIPSFLSKNATLTYVNKDDLTGTKSVTGVVGKATLNMLSENVKITGNLEVPFPTEIPMTGQITWSSG
ncbi:hypothetical protein JR316_0004014 [Psilocybe cubensis]|uniref:Uncharacterized protein n=2 Tax=Psilocybe cubensis TaxID=181762 RepID=A0ACB8HA28_PSICU|nr:hypothetical protein JR316_0004014 [Psilocybe cubensis]KAH9484532.1 hypothetical protein JR316_0004014 [Psilocybe cubensis]